MRRLPPLDTFAAALAAADAALFAAAFLAAALFAVAFLAAALFAADAADEADAAALFAAELAAATSAAAAAAALPILRGDDVLAAKLSPSEIPSRGSIVAPGTAVVEVVLAADVAADAAPEAFVPLFVRA